jgi:3-oxoacyl-[acyl-carrier protein] reductase
MSNSVVIVTGASQGIGRATAMQLARDFNSVVLVARNRTKLEETAAAAAAAHATPLIVDLDLSERSSARAVVERALSTFGRIDARSPRHPMQRLARSMPRLSLLQRRFQIAELSTACRSIASCWDPS